MEREREREKKRERETDRQTDRQITSMYLLIVSKTALLDTLRGMIWESTAQDFSKCGQTPEIPPSPILTSNANVYSCGAAQWADHTVLAGWNSVWLWGNNNCCYSFLRTANALGPIHTATATTAKRRLCASPVIAANCAFANRVD